MFNELQLVRMELTEYQFCFVLSLTKIEIGLENPFQMSKMSVLMVGIVCQHNSYDGWGNYDKI